jgi:hypothetical protein
MSKKKTYSKEDYKRTDITWNLQKDGDVYSYLEENVDNIAGFLKMLARDYVRNQKSFNHRENPEMEKEVKDSTVIRHGSTSSDNTGNDKQNRKMLPIRSNAFSSKDLGIFD